MAHGPQKKPLYFGGHRCDIGDGAIIIHMAVQMQITSHKGYGRIMVIVRWGWVHFTECLFNSNDSFGIGLGGDMRSVECHSSYTAC